MTQVELAAKAGVEQSTVSRAEAGYEGTTLRALKALAAALDTTVADLVATEGEVAEARLLESSGLCQRRSRKVALQMAEALARSEGAAA